MKRASEWFKQKKTLIIVAALIALLILIVFLFFGEHSYGGAAKSSEELRLISILESMDGVGDADVMISKEEDGAVAGVVVVCEGADRILIKNDILNAVSTALNINKNIIAIYSK